mgnify:CR=1 FL=1
MAFQTRSDLEKCHKENNDGCFFGRSICQTIKKITNDKNFYRGRKKHFKKKLVKSLREEAAKNRR